MNLTKILADCIEWAEATCDNDFTVAEFFDMLDLRGNDYAYAAMLTQLDEQGFFEEK